MIRFRIGVIHVHEHKFRHNIKDSPTPYVICKKEIESAEALISSLLLRLQT